MQVLVTSRSHAPDAQSEGKRQSSPSAQPGQPPPQSTPVSLWLSTPSAQVGTVGSTQRLVMPTSQLPETQSPLSRQSRPLAQGAQGPPQSTSLSPPFCTRSSQRTGGGAQVLEAGSQ